MANRLVRSATWEGMCDQDGRPSGRLAAYYANLAAGGVGLIITGYSFIRPDGKQLPGQMGIHSDEFEKELKALTNGVHDRGGKICLQAVHCGGQTTSRYAGSLPLAPSSLATAQYPEVPVQLSSEEIKLLVRQFGESARRAREAGFDAVQIHAAHGYLINQFLSPLTNRRVDDYGGSPGNRCRFLLEVYHCVRSEVGSDFPVLVKLNGSDKLEGGFDLEGALYAARALDEEGIDAIEVSAGTPASGNLSPVRQSIEASDQEAYNLSLAAGIKKAVTCPILSVGGFRTYEIIEGVIRRGEVDYIALSRPFIREPHLVRRWQEGKEARARCISCNGCFKPGLKEGGIYCVVDRIEEESKGISV